MSPDTVWLISVLILALLGGCLGGYLAYKKMKHISIATALIIAVVVFVSFQLLFILDNSDKSMGFRLVFSLIFSVLGFAYFYVFMAFRKRFRKAVGLKDKNEENNEEN